MPKRELAESKADMLLDRIQDMQWFLGMSDRKFLRKLFVESWMSGYDRGVRRYRDSVTKTGKKK